MRDRYSFCSHLKSRILFSPGGEYRGERIFFFIANATADLLQLRDEEAIRSAGSHRIRWVGPWERLYLAMGRFGRGHLMTVRYIIGFDQFPLCSCAAQKRMGACAAYLRP